MLDLLHEQVKAAPPTPAVNILPPLHPRTTTAHTLPISRTTSLLDRSDDTAATTIVMRKMSDLTPVHSPLLQPLDPTSVFSYPASAPTSPVKLPTHAATHTVYGQTTAAPYAANTASAMHTASIERRIAELEHSLSVLRHQSEADHSTHQQHLARLTHQYEERLRDTATQRRQAERQYEEEIAELVRRIETVEDERHRQEMADSAEREQREAELRRLKDEVDVHKRREEEWMSERGSRDDVLRGMVDERERKIGETIRYYDERMQRWKDVVRSIKEEMKEKVDRTHAMMAQLKVQLTQEKEQNTTLTQQMHALQHSHKLHVEELERDLERLQGQKEEATHRLEQLAEQREQEVVTLQSQVSELQEMITVLQTQWHTREAEVAAVMQQWERRWEEREQTAAHDVYLLAFDKDEQHRVDQDRRQHDEHVHHRLQSRVAELEREVEQRLEAFRVWGGGRESREEVARWRREKEVEERRRRVEESVRYGLEREVQQRREESKRISGLEQEVLKLGLRVREAGGSGSAGMVVSVLLMCQLMGGVLYVLSGDLLSGVLSPRSTWWRGLQGWL